jgi:hypothetical protein
MKALNGQDAQKCCLTAEQALKFLAYSSQSSINSWISNIPCRYNRTLLYIQNIEPKIFLLLKNVPKYEHIWVNWNYVFVLAVQLRMKAKP